MEYTGHYALNNRILAKMGILDDYLDAYRAVIDIFEKEADRIRSKKGNDAAFPTERDPHVHSKIKKVLDNLINSYIFLYTDDYSRLFINAYSYEVVKIYSGKNDQQNLFVSFEYFLSMLQNVVARIIFVRESRQNPSVQEHIIQEKVSCHIYDTILSFQLGERSFATCQLLSPQCAYHNKSSQLSLEEQQIIQNEMDQFSSAHVWLRVLFNKKESREIIIVGKASEVRKNVLSIKNDFAKELLTAAFWGARGGTGCYQGKKYTIQKIYINTRSHGCEPIRLFPTTVQIKKNGGIFTGTEESTIEIVSILMYSPITKKFESAYASYDSVANEIFMDAKVFRKYISKYGRPKVNLELTQSNSVGQFTEWQNLNTESVLMEFGYSVSESASLTTAERQKCLTDIVDLEILSVKKIVSQLEFNIRIHTGDRNYTARCKWQEDIDYILAYKVNPSRFFIAQC